MPVDEYDFSLDEVDLRVAASDWLGQGPVLASGPEVANGTQIDFIKVGRAFGRFGNNFYQAMHAVVIAKALRASRIIMPRFAASEAFGYDPELGLSVTFDLCKDMAFHSGLSGTFYVPYGFESIFLGQSPALLSKVLRSATDLLYPNCISSSQKHVLAIHIRAGDIFAEGSQANWYVQPPAAFYTKAIDHALTNHPYEHCELVYEDRGNPAVGIVESYLRDKKVSFDSEPRDLLADVRRLSSAHGLVCSFSSFAEASALISRSVHNIYCFRSVTSQIDFAPFLQTRLIGIYLERSIKLFIVEDMSVNFIAPKTWKNSADQRAAIATYPESHLRLFAFTKYCM